jgi:DNA repair protein RadC
MKERIKIKKPIDVLPLMETWKKRREEHFLSVTLNGSHDIIKIHHITKGLVNRTLTHPRECFYHAILDYATAVVFIHNHPSGNENPSSEDDVITHKLCMAGEILGIKVLDHIIITPRDSFYSYRRAQQIQDNYSAYELDRFIESIAAEDAP